VNYSSFSKGINGIMIDVQYSAGCNALPAGTLTATQVANTLEFIETAAGASGRTVASAYTGTNRTATAPVAIAPHPTLANTDRIKIIFPDGTSTNGHWLRTRVFTQAQNAGSVIDNLTSSANAAPDGDRFYFGLAMGNGLSTSTSGGTSFATTGVIDQTNPKPP